MKQAVILAGGMGTRLGSLTADTPKPLLNVGGQAFLDYLIEQLIRHGAQHLVLLVGPHGEEFRRHLSDGIRHNVRVDLVSDMPSAGTGGALTYAKGLLSDEFLMVNGDSYFDINLLDLAIPSTAAPATARIALRTVQDTDRYGRTVLEGDRVVQFAEKSARGPGTINAGVYWLKKSILNLLPSGSCSLEEQIFPTLSKKGDLAGKAYRASFIDIGIPEDFERAQSLLPCWRRRPAAFLDRDGVINHDTGYVWRAEEYQWMEGSIEAIKRLNDLGYYVFVVTNQAGVARGLYRMEDVDNLHRYINQTLNKAGAHIDAFYFCPHHPEIGDTPLTMKCDCRKPQPGMILKAMQEWSVDITRSFMIGDKGTDMQAAAAADIPTRRLFLGGDIEATMREIAPPWRAFDRQPANHPQG